MLQFDAESFSDVLACYLKANCFPNCLRDSKLPMILLPQLFLYLLGSVGQVIISFELHSDLVQFEC